MKVIIVVKSLLCVIFGVSVIITSNHFKNIFYVKTIDKYVKCIDNVLNLLFPSVVVAVVVVKVSVKISVKLVVYLQLFVAYSELSAAGFDSIHVPVFA